MLIKNHISMTASKIKKNHIVEGRLKCLLTIIDKLKRPILDGENENAIKLTRIKNIGRYRTIVKNKD